MTEGARWPARRGGSSADDDSPDAIDDAAGVIADGFIGDFFHRHLVRRFCCRSFRTLSSLRGSFLAAARTLDGERDGTT